VPDAVVLGPASVSVVAGLCGGGGFRFMRTKFGIATIGEPSANEPVMVGTPPSRSLRNSTASFDEGASVFAMS
jgi:hypothetical protein